MALAYHGLERKKESDAALAELVDKYHAEGASQIAEVYAFRGEADRAFEWLARAYAQRDGGLAYMKGDPLLKNLQSAADVFGNHGFVDVWPALHLHAAGRW